MSAMMTQSFFTIFIALIVVFYIIVFYKTLMLLGETWCDGYGHDFLKSIAVLIGSVLWPLFWIGFFFYIAYLIMCETIEDNIKNLFGG